MYLFGSLKHVYRTGHGRGGRSNPNGNRVGTVVVRWSPYTLYGAYDVDVYQLYILYYVYVS